MHRLSILLFAFLLVFPGGYAAAQGETALESIALRLGVHVMPLSIFQIRPRFRTGLMATKGRSAFSLDLEFNGAANAIEYGGDCPTGLPILSFYGLQPEVKWFNKQRPADGWFVALTGIVNYSRSNVDDLVFLPVEGYVYGAEQEDFRLAAVGKVGRLTQLGTKAYFEWYLGLGGGIRRYSYDNFGVVVPEDEAFAQCGESAFRGTQTTWRPEFQLGLKFGIWVK